MDATYHYSPPELIEFGTLAQLTGDLDLVAGVVRTVAGVAVMSAVIAPGADQGAVSPSGADTVPAPGGGNGGTPQVLPDSGDTLNESLTNPSGADGPGAGATEPVADPGGGGGGQASAGTGGESRLPFTGFAVFPLALLGAGFAAVGATLRSRIRPPR